jgi:hypothetical protein
VAQWGESPENSPWTSLLPGVCAVLAKGIAKMV